MSSEEVVFKNIPNISESYLAGSDGNIYSKKLNFNKKLKACKCSKGNYLHVSLTDLKGKRKSILVHIAVCSAFNGPKPSEELQVAHKDGDSFNNLPTNLMWATCKENMSHKELHGTTDGGVRNTRASLSKEKLFVVRWLLGNTNHLTHSEIASIVGENREMISKVNNRSRYSTTEVVVIEILGDKHD